MSKPHLAFVLLFAFGTLSLIFGQQKPGLEIDLDKTELFHPCRQPFPAKYRTCPDGMTITISAKLSGRQRRDGEYKYSVSGGKILGTGPKVVWDMTSAMPGTYVVTLTVGSGATKKTVEKKIHVQECSDCTMECLRCPHDMLVSSKDSARPGDLITVSVKDQLGPKYNWRIEGATIVEGQGTDRITLRVEKDTTRSSVIIVLDVLDEFCFEAGGCPLPRIEIPIN